MSAAQVRAYAGKADEYLAAAASELIAGRSIAGTSLAIHAAINAADADTGRRIGLRAAGHGSCLAANTPNRTTAVLPLGAFGRGRRARRTVRPHLPPELTITTAGPAGQRGLARVARGRRRRV